jgi:hypothetical protein
MVWVNNPRVGSIASYGATSAWCLAMARLEQDRTGISRFRKGAEPIQLLKRPLNAQTQGPPCLSSQPATALPAAIVEAQKAVAGNPPKARASFAKARCVRGTYVSSDRAKDITDPGASRTVTRAGTLFGEWRQTLSILRLGIKSHWDRFKVVAIRPNGGRGSCKHGIGPPQTTYRGAACPRCRRTSRTTR